MIDAQMAQRWIVAAVLPKGCASASRWFYGFTSREGVQLSCGSFKNSGTGAFLHKRAVPYSLEMPLDVG